MEALNLIKKPSRFGLAVVQNIIALTPNMLRITLRSDMIGRYDEACIGGHFKLIIPDADQDHDGVAEFLTHGDVKKFMRTYTIRHIRRAEGEIDVDFVKHKGGLAGRWANNVSVGAYVGVSMPGAPKLKTKNARRFLVAADMAALPAAACGLEALPKDAQGEAWFEILSDEDRQLVRAPQGISINWVVKKDPAQESHELIEAMMNAPVEEGATSVFVAGEHQLALALRQHFTRLRPIAKSLLYISSYWKYGLDEQAHKTVKISAG